METGNTDLVRRTGHQYDDLPGIEDLDDITYSTDEDYDDDDSNYGGDREDNDEFPDERKIVKDPGPFRYNRKMVIVSLPCAIMVLTLVGELFLMAASFGAGIIVILDPKGEKKRCAILFTLLFICCHAFTIFSILPLLWLSLFNIFLIGVVNLYVILTGGLIALQFTYIRKYELKLALMIEKLLFSLYPWCCIILLTWTCSALVPWPLLPYVFITIGFVYLQLFITPHSSSFILDNKAEDSKELDDLNVVPEVVSLLMAIVYSTAPTLLYIALNVINNPLRQLFSLNVMLQLVFISALSVFLSSLMSLRAVFEFTGWPYVYVVRGRWVAGAVCTLFVYPVLTQFQLTSHFLPWLPAGIAIYGVYGALLSDKKFKGTSLILLPLPCLLFGYWMTWLPWKIVFNMLFGLDIQILYSLLLANCVLCFLSVYTASYGSDNLFSALVTLECVVFTMCEVMLYKENLYSQSFLVMTAVTLLYTLHRLHVVGRMGSWTYTLSSAVHLCKVLVVIIYSVIGQDDTLTAYRVITLFFLAIALIRVVSLEEKLDRTVKEVVYLMLGLCVAVVMNSPLLRLLCIYVLWEEPTVTDTLGLSVLVCGVSVVVVGSLQMSQEYITAVRQLGAVMASVGVLILVLQPTMAFSWQSAVQWGDVGSVVLVATVLLSGYMSTLRQLALAAVLVGICPGIRLATLLYAYSEETPASAMLFRMMIYIPACICLTTMMFIFVKLDIVQKQLEKWLLFLCGCLGLLSAMLLFMDVGFSAESEALMSLPAWKLFTVTTAVVSFSLKVLSTTQDLCIPLVSGRGEKSLPQLPLMGNIACMLTFLFACIQSPARGLLNDIWCCGASLILLCLQRDKRLLNNIRQDNQIVPTMFMSLCVLLLSSVIHSDMWSTGGVSFLRGFLEVITIFATLPTYYILWGLLWEGKLLLSEQVVVFLVPVHTIYLLFGSSYTSQALALVGLYSGIWMMVTKLPLRAYQPDDR
ncbi:uncharacterized protein LOC128238855 isoform X2 [Mya arenaria]|uniref:uncharacterized protein LOC128238855 isoform X2 n=1 Tax=Mya arenaria TaxID=6604 RepID=UPI0022E50B84|nr:uncharacterized protein LOC128238855 isoform X2 [Mya arenaria]